MSWEQKLKGCFSVTERKFAWHTLERKRALVLLADLIEQHVEWASVEDEIRHFLSEYSDQLIENQVAAAKSLYHPWLERKYLSENVDQ